MDYIADKALYKAVMFARRMIDEGLESGIAIPRAASYYEVEVHDVAYYVRQASGRNCQRRLWSS